MGQPPPFTEMLSRLVHEPSVSCTNPEYDLSNLAVIELLANWFEDLGFATEITPLPGQPHKANLIAHAGPVRERLNANDNSSAGLLLAGHTDTVPCDPNRWTSDPFTTSNRDDRFYGLGTCDMKGFFGIVLDALRERPLRNLQQPLTIVATSDEESSMAGARLIQEGAMVRAQAAVIVEPTNLQPIYAHKGIMMLAVRLTGRSGHSSNPALGCNALDAMHWVMGELLEFRHALAQDHQHPGFEVDVPTLNLGCMHAGDNPNRICGHAELQIDLRLLPGMAAEVVIDALRRRLETISQRCATTLELVPLYPPVPALETTRDALLVQHLERISGRSPGTVAYGTEGPFFHALGMDTVIFGPGSIDQAHQPNEYLAHDQVNPAVNMIGSLIDQYCGTNSQ